MMFIVTKETLNALVTACVRTELAKHGVVVENLVLDDVTAGLEEKRIVKKLETKKLETKKKKEVEVTTATIDLFDELDSKAAVPVLAEAKEQKQQKKALTSAEQEQKEQAKLQKEQEKAAKEQEKQDKKALAEAKEQEKLAKKALADAKEQEKKALADAKEQEKLAKEQEKLAKEQAKLAKEQEKAAKKALAEQKEQAKLLKEQAKALAGAAKASPAVVEKNDEDEEDEDVVNKFEFMGTMYLKSKKTGQIYNMEQDPIGMWNETTKKIDFDEEGEEFEE